jgi:hypothetical protein
MMATSLLPAGPGAGDGGACSGFSLDVSDSDSNMSGDDWLMAGSEAESAGFDVTDTEGPSSIALEEAAPADGFLLDAPFDVEGPTGHNFGSWTPGQDVGNLITRGRGVAPLGPQGQVLMANCYLSMNKLGSSILKKICESLGPVRDSRTVVRKTSLPQRAAASVLCASAHTVKCWSGKHYTTPSEPGLTSNSSTHCVDYH